MTAAEDADAHAGSDASETDAKADEDAPPEASDAVSGVSGGETEASDEPAEASDGERPTNVPDPDPQPETLRRQQYYVSIGAGLLAGGAFTTSLYQRFPDLPVLVALVAGVFATGVVIWLMRKSIFPGEGEATQV